VFKFKKNPLLSIIVCTWTISWFFGAN
jgi:hypothetical protein